MKVLAVFGTRPEAIKMCPLVKELKRREKIVCKVCLTGQHREMLRQVMDCFEIKEDYNLDIMRTEQSLTSITTGILEKMEPILRQEAPDVVLVHGDTTTSFAAALAAFYQQIPVGHVEAGLRTWNRYSPFPEELNRCLTGKLSTFHFAPTKDNEDNLRRENISENVFVTGNTVIDAFETTVKKDYQFRSLELDSSCLENKRLIMITAHRRENIGKPLENICHAVKRIAENFKDVVVAYPVHLNPKVRQIVYQYLSQCERVFLMEPLDVIDMHNLMDRSYMVMTDSGGLQEESPALGKPVLVMRTETERQEAVKAGTVRLVGVEEEKIYQQAAELLEDEEEYRKMAHAINPYGDGHASKRIADILEELFCKNSNLSGEHT